MEIDKLSIRIMWKGSQWLTHHNNFNDNNNLQGLSDWLRELPHPRVHGVDHLPPVSQHHSHSKGLICFWNRSVHQNFVIEKTNEVNHLRPVSQHHFHFKGELKVFSKYMYDHWKGTATVAFLICPYGKCDCYDSRAGPSWQWRCCKGWWRVRRWTREGIRGWRGSVGVGDILEWLILTCFFWWQWILLDRNIHYLGI